MDFEEIKTKSTEELLKLTEELKEELRVLRFKLNAQNLKQNNKISVAKKTIARIKTELKLRALNEK